jgi:hypothetical protein
LDLQLRRKPFQQHLEHIRIWHRSYLIAINTILVWMYGRLA